MGEHKGEGKRTDKEIGGSNGMAEGKWEMMRLCLLHRNKEREGRQREENTSTEVLIGFNDT